MRKLSKKLIICLMVFLLLFNFITSSVGKLNFVYADTDPADEVQSEVEESIGGVLNGIAGIITWIPRAMMVGIGALIQLEAYFIVNTAGHGQNNVSVLVTPFDIFFNNFTLTNINIFSTDDLADANGTVDEDGVVYKIRQGVAMWYFVVRMIAIAILLVMLILIAIKAAFSTLAEEKARYKKMFVDWLVSAGMVILMSVIIVATITVNNAIVSSLKGAASSAQMDDMIASLRTQAFSVNFLLSWGCAIAYFLLAVQTFIFVLIYIKRFLVTCFLIIISPLMPLAYSIDKAKGSQAISLNGWAREFFSNVFIQPVHCLLYLAILGAILQGIQGASINSLNSLAETILLIAGMMFIPQAEDLLRRLLGFDKSNTISSIKSITNSASNTILSGAAIATGVAGQQGLSNMFASQVTKNNVNNTTNNNPVYNNTRNFVNRASTMIHSARNNAASYLEGMEGEGKEGKVAEGDAKVATNREGQEQAQNQQEAVGENAQRERRGAMPSPAAGNNQEVSNELKKVEDAVESTKHNEKEENNEQNKEVNVEETREEKTTESNEVNENRVRIEEDENNEGRENQKPETKNLTPEEQEERDRIKGQYDRILSEIEQSHSLLNQINMKLNSFAISSSRRKEIEDQIKDLYNKNGDKEASKYADTLKTNDEKDFAKTYIDYLKTQERANNNLNPENGKVINLVESGVEKGALSPEEAAALYKNATNSRQRNFDNVVVNSNERENRGNEQRPENESVNAGASPRMPRTVVINNRKEEKTENNSVRITDDLQIPKSVADTAANLTKLVTMNTSKVLEALKADISVDGDFNTENMIKFNSQVVKRATSTTKSDIEKLYKAVQEQGDDEVRRVKEFERNMTVQNAEAIKSQAGRAYAQAVTYGKQAGVFVTEVNMAYRKSENRSDNQSTTMTAGIRSNTNNVVTDINKKRNVS